MFGGYRNSCTIRKSLGINMATMLLSHFMFPLTRPCERQSVHGTACKTGPRREQFFQKESTFTFITTRILACCVPACFISLYVHMQLQIDIFFQATRLLSCPTIARPLYSNRATPNVSMYCVVAIGPRNQMDILHIVQ